MFDTRLYAAHIPLSIPSNPLSPLPSFLKPRPRPISSLSLSKLTKFRFASPFWNARFREEMAQKTEKEETEFKVPETLTLCDNNCGVTGNPATKNMCQKCFNATTATTSSSPSSTANATSGGVVAGGASVMKFSGEPSSRSGTSRSLAIRSDCVSATATTSSRSDNSGVEAALEKKVVNRCSGCRKRVGLTGFRCRCGELFCAEHRYSDRHDCNYDYKAAGREAIARENPVVKAAKIVKV